MLYTTQIREAGLARPAIGVARALNSRLTQEWVDDGRLEIVDVIPELGGPCGGYPGKTESPHAFAHINASGDTSYYLLATGSDCAVPAHDRLLRNRRSSWDHGTDTGPDHWNLSSSLYDELGFATLDPVVFGGWEATEYCRMDDVEYMAGVNATIGVDSTYAVWIVRVQWLPGSGGAPDQMMLLNPVTDVGQNSDKHEDVIANGLRVAGGNPGRAPLGLEIALVADQVVELDVYDVQGRAVQRLASGMTSAGRHMIPWDGYDHGGKRAPCGMYFARLRWPRGQNVVRMVLLR
jgi:hypothetical protein